MGVTAEQVQFYVNSIYGMILGDTTRRDAILSELERMFKNHPKMSITRKAQTLAILKMARHPTITSLIKPANLLLSMRKHWHHRKAVTSRLVPKFGASDADEQLEDHLVASVLRVVLKHFGKDDIDKFYSLLEKVIQFAEPHALAGKWDQDKPLVEFSEWVPLSEYGKQQQHDSSAVGHDRQSGSGVCADEGSEEGEVKGEEEDAGTSTNTSTGSTKRRRTRGKGGKKAKKDDDSC